MLIEEATDITISTTQQEPFDALYLDNGHKASQFDMYLEFILYWTKTDVENYRTAIMMIDDRNDKEILVPMVGRKMDMFNILSTHRSNKRKELFESAFGDAIKMSVGGFMIDTDIKPIKSRIDAFHFAYKKEYQGLHAFEKIGRWQFESPIRILLETAIEHQRQHILYLDSRISTEVNFAVIKEYPLGIESTEVNDWL